MSTHLLHTWTHTRPITLCLCFIRSSFVHVWSYIFFLYRHRKIAWRWWERERFCMSCYDFKTATTTWKIKQTLELRVSFRNWHSSLTTFKHKHSLARHICCVLRKAKLSSWNRDCKQKITRRPWFIASNVFQLFDSHYIGGVRIRLNRHSDWFNFIIANKRM